MSIKIAVAGCGGMARRYLHRYTEIPGAELALVVDTRADAAEEKGKLFGVPWSASFDDCLADGIDIVDISTPNHLHHGQALAAIAAGKHIIIQKPMTVNAAEAGDIVTAAKAKGVTAGMYMYMHDNPLFLDIKRMIPLLGRLSAVHCRCAHTGGITMPAGTWRGSREQTGGGSFIQLTVHNMNILQWLIDDQITNVMAFSKNLMCPNIGGDDVTTVACEFASGILGTLASGYNSEKDELSICGDKGYICLDDQRFMTLKLSEPFVGEMFNYRTPGERMNIEMPYSDFSWFEKDNPHDQHILFVKAVMEGKPAPVPADVGWYDMRVVEAIYKSAETGVRCAV